MTVLTFHHDAALVGVLSPRTGEWCSLPYAFVRGGHSGVNLFFVLSAFLLSLPFLAAADWRDLPSSRRPSAARWR